MKRYRITINDQSYDVEILSDPRASEVQVKVDGEEFSVVAESALEAETPAASVAAAPVRRAAPVAPASSAPAPMEAPANGSDIVKAPLPGVVKTISVRPGQTVAFNDELLVLEAMKAMNIIRAPRAGTIGKIYVTEGRQVAYGAALLDLS